MAGCGARKCCVPALLQPGPCEMSAMAASPAPSLQPCGGEPSSPSPPPLADGYFFKENQFVIWLSAQQEDGLLSCRGGMHLIEPLRPIFLTVKNVPKDLSESPGTATVSVGQLWRPSSCGPWRRLSQRWSEGSRPVRVCVPRRRAGYGHGMPPHPRGCSAARPCLSGWGPSNDVPRVC